MYREPRIVTYPFGRYWWQEVNPHEWQISTADAAQTFVGRLIEVPPHGRDKGKWLLPDARQEYPTSEQAVMGLELWRKLDLATAPSRTPEPPRLDPKEAAIEAALAQAAQAAPAPTPTEPEPDMTGWLGTTEAAPVYGMSRNAMMVKLTAGEIPGARKVPHGNRAGFRYLIPPPANVPPPAPVVVEVPPAPEPPASKPERAPRPVAAPAFDPAPLYQEIGRLHGRIDALANDVRYLALRLQAQPAPVPISVPAPSLWQRIAGVPTNGHSEGGQS